MTEREQVIAELLYLKHDCLEGSAIDQTLDKAIALLKAQEPHVMTLEEIRKWEQPDVWMEFRKDGTIEPTSRIGFGAIASVVTNGTVNPPVTMVDGYGITWRCWTSRPTDEQREATPWMKS